MPRDHNRYRDKYQDAYERIAEGIDREYGDRLEDEESFLDAYREYMKDSKVRDDSRFQRNSLDAYLEDKNIPYGRRERFRKRIQQGKTEKIQQLRRQEVPSKRIIRKRGKRKRTLRFTILAKQKGKTVYARRIKTKVGIRYVTKQGYRARKV